MNNSILRRVQKENKKQMYEIHLHHPERLRFGRIVILRGPPNRIPIKACLKPSYRTSPLEE